MHPYDLVLYLSCVVLMNPLDPKREAMASRNNSV